MNNNDNRNHEDPDADIKKDIEFVIAMMTPGEGNTPVTQADLDTFKREVDMRFKSVHNKIYGVTAAIANVARKLEIVARKLEIEKNEKKEAAKEPKKAPEPMHTTD
jgi:hypothetical protein